MDRVSCKRIKNSLSAYVDGELTSEQNSLIEKHLQDCVSCQKDLSALKSLQNRLNALAQVTPLKEPTISLPEKITSGLPKYDFGIFTDPVIQKIAIGMTIVLILLVGGLKIKQDLGIISHLEALVVEVQGEAENFRDNRWQPIKPYSTFSGNELLRTGIGSLKIQLIENSGLLLNGKSLLEIKRLLPQVEFSLIKGGLLVFVAKFSKCPKIIIHTPAVQIQVYGTLFKVFVGEGFTEVKVLEGKVKLKHPLKNKVVGMVKQLEKVVIFNGQPAVTGELLSEEIEKLKNEFAGADLSIEIKKPVPKRGTIILWREIK